MKQVIIRKRKKIKIHQIKRSLVRTAALAAALCLLCSHFSLQVWAGESAKTEDGAVTEENTAAGSREYEIFHRHTGSGADGGGCYQEAVYHSHEGNEATGGSCYETPIYHTHTGSEAEGGACYGTVLYHTHAGSAQSGGACYGPVYHTHTGSCEDTRDCSVTYSSVGPITSTTYKECHHHGQSVHGTSTAVEEHNGCGRRTEVTIEYCVTCGPHAGGHTYTANTCGMNTSTVVGYQLTCTKSDTTPESYELDCGKSAEMIDAYGLSCEKDARTIDGYRVNCGLEDSRPVAKLIVSNETEGNKETVELRARIEDLTGGKLDFSNGTYQWYDSGEKLFSQGNSVCVEQNGEYRVEFVPGDNEKQLAGLSGRIQVDNVYHPTPAPVHKPDDGKNNDAGQEDNGQDSGGQPGQHVPQAEGTQNAAPTASPAPVITPTPSATPKQVLLSEAGEKHGDAEESGNSRDGNKAAPTLKPEPAPTVTPGLKPAPEPSAEVPEEFLKETETNQVLGQERKEGDFNRWLRNLADFFKKPVGKVITITTGTLLLAGLTGLIVIFLRKTVKVYNDDGTGRLIYLGRCMVLREGDDFSITITEEMTERSCTNRYVVRPGFFLIGKSQEQALFVCKGKKRIAIYLSKEMIVVI